MTHYIVVAEEPDLLAMQDIIADLLPGADVEIVEAEGKNFAYSLGRTIVMQEVSPTAVVLDAGTRNPEIIRDIEINFDDLVTSLPGDAPLTLILAVPTLEIAKDDGEFRQKLAEFLESNQNTLRRHFDLSPR
ncbi:hypothetical protein ELH67_08535 [Rhizobium ruizarguesonis]|uniref:hypothetical protein n=1 Tax=Rhizobium ruizarguesonis TaxID=2081791 RepID=UPI001030E2B2|nr:hypothetical protein [Rhizobium ruizarguesonis]TAZ94594.1 hypothetical protein ELH67_08535 [Rhizobium ruizarguesonis]